MPFDVEMPDGTVVEGVPDGTTKAQIQAKYAAHTATSRSLGNIASSAISNLPRSAANLGENIYSAIRHPLDTGKTLLDVGAGELQKLAPEPIRNAINSVDFNPQAGQQANETASNVNQFYKDRYGSTKGFGNAVAEDPVGVMADAATLVGGAGLAAKAGGLTKAAALADKLGTVANPISLAGKGISATAKGGGKLLSEALGTTTGTSGPTIRTAFGAGLQGGPEASAFRANISGDAPIEGIVSDARTAVGSLLRQRGANYRSDMGSVSGDPATLSLNPVDEAIAKTNSINNFKGIDLSPETAQVRQKISDAVEQWRALPAQDFHTAEGFDALKKRIGFIRDDTEFGSPSRTVADQAYHAVKDQIVDQAPAYGKTMADYSKASDQIKDIQNTLSLGPNANVDTSVRKLQSALRDNVNTSYGRRADLAQILKDNGAPQLMEKIAGQQLSAPMTRGIGRLLAGGEIGTALMHPGLATTILPALAASSPRLVGEIVHAAGKGARLGKVLKMRPDASLVADQLGQQNNQGNGALAQNLLSRGTR